MSWKIIWRHPIIPHITLTHPCPTPIPHTLTPNTLQCSPYRTIYLSQSICPSDWTWLKAVTPEQHHRSQLTIWQSDSSIRTLTNGLGSPRGSKTRAHLSNFIKNWPSYGHLKFLSYELHPPMSSIEQRDEWWGDLPWFPFTSIHNPLFPLNRAQRLTTHTDQSPHRLPHTWQNKTNPIAAAFPPQTTS